MYFGHGKLPWQVGVSELSINRATSRHSTTVTTDTYEETPQSTLEAEASDSQRFAAVSEQEPHVSSNETAESEKAEAAVETESSPAPSEEVAATPAKEPAESDEAAASKVEDSGEVPVDEKFLEGIAAFQNQLNDSPSEEVEEEDASVAKEETATKDEPAAEENTDQASPDDVPEDEADDVLAGINSFRAQLEDMQGSDEPSQEDSESADVHETEEAEATP